MIQKHDAVIMETDRLWLRPISWADRAFILSVFSNPDVTRYLFDQEPITDMAGAEAIIDVYLQGQYPGACRWILVRKADGACLGTCGLHCWDKAKGTIEIGYDLLPAYQGNGYMREALPHALRYAKDALGARLVQAHIYPGNTDSVALAEGAGFVDSGETFTEVFRGKPYLHKIYVYALQGVGDGEAAKPDANP